MSVVKTGAQARSPTVPFLCQEIQMSSNVLENNDKLIESLLWLRHRHRIKSFVKRFFIEDILLPT